MLTEVRCAMRNDIVLVPFPFDDLSSTKLRPALCLTDSVGTYEHVVVAFITSQISKTAESSDLHIIATDDDFQRTGLKVSSSIRLHRLVTVPVGLIQRRLGVLSPSYRSALVAKLKTLFAL